MVYKYKIYRIMHDLSTPASLKSATLATYNMYVHYWSVIESVNSLRTSLTSLSIHHLNTSFITLLFNFPLILVFKYYGHIKYYV